MLELDIADGEEDKYGNEFWLDFFGGPFPPILSP